MIFVSGVIAFIMLAQFYGSFSNTNRYFPFLWYPMFAQPRFDGERLVMSHRMFAVYPDGSRVPVTAAQLKVDYWRFERLIVPAVLKKDLARLATPLAQIRRLHPSAIRIDIEDDPMKITATGPAPAPMQIVGSLPIAEDDAR